MIAYHILCYKNLAQVVLQLNALYSEEDIFLVDIDNSNKLDLRILDEWGRKANVHINIDSDIAYGGAGTLRKTMRGAFMLLDLGKRWSYYVVLSGQCLPIKSNQDIKEKLAKFNKNEMNCIRCDAYPPVSLKEIPVLNKSNSIKLLTDKGHSKLYNLPGVTEPHYTKSARWRGEIVELGHISEAYWQPCNDLLMRRREDFFSDYQFCAGANWFNLHRSLLEYMRDDNFTYELYEVISTTFFPDESFFQTYIFNSPFKEKIHFNYMRHIERNKPPHGVKIFEISDWDDILKSDALYARKFDVEKDRGIITKVLNHTGIKAVA